MRNLIHYKHIKGIAVGFPLNEYGKEMKHCQFIKRFIAKFHRLSAPNTPVVLINESYTTRDAKRIIVDIQQVMHPDNPDIIFRKRMYDRVAAKLILQQFLDYMNEKRNLITIDI